MKTRILFVCLGNICRSPTAEGVFRQISGGAYQVDSAGTSGWHIGDPPYGPMQDAARVRGYDLSNLRARQFVADDFERFDLILGMDDQNMRDIERLNSGGRAKAQKLTTFGTLGADHVPDPYYTRDFDQALDIIENAARGLLTHLKAEADQLKLQ
ncbi:low molecular weight protein-tyrosine-phosphatase [Pseudaestuariivita rosea]|uniref:low molecular weight protein-tyrosine-phosphatase n=1 Tax=Pseudaestuariivita rosea TaxID=2763263 RepID=UPI001ABB5296|nr:low molecular weight protein-tyrosine-phosphatase [Pseudaestuariivita rosea]